MAWKLYPLGLLRDKITAPVSLSIYPDFRTFLNGFSHLLNKGQIFPPLQREICHRIDVQGLLPFLRENLEILILSDLSKKPVLDK